MHASSVYESSASRVALTYRLLARKPAASTLLACVPDRPPVQLEGWVGDLMVRELGQDLSPLRELKDSSFDCVILHWTLDQYAAAPPRRRAKSDQLHLLSEAARLLRAGGTLSGCVANFAARAPEGGITYGRTHRSLERMLEAAGFSELSLSVALPTADSPRVLVGTSPVAARHFFTGQLAQADGPASRLRLGRLIRAALVHSGLMCQLQGELMFTARKP